MTEQAGSEPRAEQTGSEPRAEQTGSEPRAEEPSPAGDQSPESPAPPVASTPSAPSVASMPPAAPESTSGGSGPSGPPVPAGHPGGGVPPATAPAEVPGYVLSNPYVQPTTSGLALGGLVSGAASCVIGLLSCCWWPMAALPFVMGLGGIVLGYSGIRQVADSAGEITGRGVAIAGVVTGAVGLVLTLLAVVIGLIVRANPGSMFG